ncbi:MAG: sugar transferase [Desulfovibrio sp.]
MRFVEKVTTSVSADSDCLTRPMPNPGDFRHGYTAPSPLASLWNTVFNRAAGAVLLLLTLPVILTLACVIKCINPGPVFYMGTRLGLNRVPFYMYKFRTLNIGTQKTIGAEMYSEKKQEISPFLKLMRDTRLDELPQFYNVVKGEMALVGPRPVRPELYENVCTDLSGYDIRFLVRPGLVGFSQLFTPHGTPKRIRSLIDARLATTQRNTFWDIIIIGYTGITLLRSLVSKSWNLLGTKLLLRLRHGRPENEREHQRVRVKNAVVFMAPAEDENTPSKGRQEYVQVGELKDCTDTHFRFRTHEKLALDTVHKFRLQRMLSKRKGTIRKRAYCTGRIFRRTDSIHPEQKYDYIVEYFVETPLQQYLMDKYYLNKSIS